MHAEAVDEKKVADTFGTGCGKSVDAASKTEYGVVIFLLADIKFI